MAKFINEDMKFIPPTMVIMQSGMERWQLRRWPVVGRQQWWKTATANASRGGGGWRWQGGRRFPAENRAKQREEKHSTTATAGHRRAQWWQRRFSAAWLGGEQWPVVGGRQQREAGEEKEAGEGEGSHGQGKAERQGRFDFSFILLLALLLGRLLSIFGLAFTSLFPCSLGAWPILIYSSNFTLLV